MTTLRTLSDCSFADLSVLELVGVPVGVKGAETLRTAVAHLEQLLLPRCQLGDRGVGVLCDGIRLSRNSTLSRGVTLKRVCLASNGLTADACGALASVVSFHTVQRAAESWRHSLRGRQPTEVLDGEADVQGLHAVDLSGNPRIGDAGACELLHSLEDDSSVTAVSFQDCGLTSKGAETVAQVSSDVRGVRAVVLGSDTALSLQVLPTSALAVVDLRDNTIGSTALNKATTAAKLKLNCTVLTGTSARPAAAEVPKWKARISPGRSSGPRPQSAPLRRRENPATVLSGQNHPRPSSRTSGKRQPQKQAARPTRTPAAEPRHPAAATQPSRRRAQQQSPADSHAHSARHVSEPDSEPTPDPPRQDPATGASTTADALADWLNAPGGLDDTPPDLGGTSLVFHEADRVLEEQTRLRAVRQRQGEGRESTGRGAHRGRAAPMSTVPEPKRVDTALPPPAQLTGLDMTEEEKAAAIRASFGHLDNIIDDLALRSAAAPAAAPSLAGRHSAERDSFT